MENEIVYIVEDAAKVVYESISEELKKRLNIDDIIEILDKEFEYQQEVGMAGNEDSRSTIEIDIPFDLNEDEMKYYIINNCTKSGIILTYDELNQILEGEDNYFESIGGKETPDYRKYFN